MRNVPELRWILEGFTPERIPMARLAEYMQQLAKMLGQEEAVHFERVERGSVAVVASIDPLQSGKVTSRIGAVKAGNGPADAMKAYTTINTMLAEDKTSAALREGSAVVIRFPGKFAAKPSPIEVPDSGSVVGYLYTLSEVGKEFHARIRLESGGTLMCRVGDDLAKKMREHLFEVVKVYGKGIWARGEEGGWTVTSLDINDVVRAESDKLGAVIDELRKLDIAWRDDPLGYVERLNGSDDTLQ